MWCLVMFDLPVDTARHRREANAYRRMLLDLGFSMGAVQCLRQVHSGGVE